MFKMTIDEAKEELVANERMQDAIVEKWSWPELTDDEYILSEHRLAKCQEEEKLLISTIDFWEQFQKGLNKKVEQKHSEYIRLSGE
jgi:hypothetical protein